MKNLVEQAATWLQSEACRSGNILERTNAVIVSFKKYVSDEKKEISERHRHRYEFNNDFRETLQKAGLCLSGSSPDGRLIETTEIPGEVFYVGVQFHPEFKSRPNRPHPLFLGFVKASLEFSCHN